MLFVADFPALEDQQELLHSESIGDRNSCVQYTLSFLYPRERELGRAVSLLQIYSDNLDAVGSLAHILIAFRQAKTKV